MGVMTMEYRIINGAISFGSNTILEEINFDVKNNEKIAIVGRNGSGKTSLLKAIVDNDMLETGLGEEDLQVIRIGKPTIGYQEQHAFSDLEVTLIDEILKVYSPIIKLEEKIKKLELDMVDNATNKMIEDYTNILERYKLIGGYEYKKEYEVALLKFGFTDSDKLKKLSEFSGGQRTKISFLKLLLSKPDILLLDEPTNHLDIVTVEWLENYLKNYPKALVVVSHDRMFLDNVVNIVYEIEYSSLTKYKGNYSSFEIQKKMNYEKQLHDYLYQQKEIKRLKDIADRFRYKPSKASMAMSKLRKIEQMQLVDKPQNYDIKTFNTDLKIDKESSKIVLTVRDLEFGYNGESLGKTSFEVYRGQKLAIIGENGKGKSTLIKTLMGVIPKISGKFNYGYNVNKEYFDQQIEFLNDENTIYDEYSMAFPDEEPLQIRKTLGAFLFVGEDVFKKIKTLSGGEKVRLALCKIMKKSPNMLLLDEPTNHLDIIGKENLEDLLVSYEGSLVFVSHDRYFINKVADSLLVFEKDKVVYFRGTYKEYLESREDNVSTKVVDKVKKDKPIKEKSLGSRIRNVEKEIDILEKKIKSLNDEIIDEQVKCNYIRIGYLQKEVEVLEKELEEKMIEWEELSS